MHLTIQQLRILESVARHLSFTRASEELFLTQPAISIQVKRLEQNVGQPLFEQIGKKLYLTEAGEEVYQASREILDRLNELEGSLDKHQKQVRGPLRLSVVTTGKYFMPHLLGGFLRTHNAVEPRLMVTNRANVLERIRDNMDDLVIMGQVPDEMNLHAVPFLDNRLEFIAVPNHPLANEHNIPLERIVEERFLSREEGSGVRSVVDRQFTDQGLHLRPYMELGSSEAIKQGVMAGLGISVLSNLSFRLELASGLLTLLNVEGFPLLRTWHCVYPKGKRLSRTSQAFLDYLLGQGNSLPGAREA
jgi:DNA-binding transcriptional LysR family regulator